MTSPEPLVQIQNYYSKVLFIMPSTKIAQMVLLCQIKWLPELYIYIFKRQLLLNHWAKFIMISQKYFSSCPLTKLHIQMVSLQQTKGPP